MTIQILTDFTLSFGSISSVQLDARDVAVRLVGSLLTVGDMGKVDTLIDATGNVMKFLFQKKLCVGEGK